MSTAIRVLLAATCVVILLGGREASGQVVRSVPGTGQPAFTQPYYQPYYGYNYGYSYPYGSYYRGPYYSIPGSGVPAYPSPYYPPAPVYSPWRLGITGTTWPGVGVRIATLEPGSPAEQMGIEVSDVIVQVNGNPIRSIYDLQSAVAASNGYARVLVLDNRTNSYMWHNGSLMSGPVAAPAVALPSAAVPAAPGAALPAPGATVPGATAPGTPAPGAAAPQPLPPPTPATPGTPPTPM